MESYLVRVTSILDDLGATIKVSDEFELDKLVVGSEVFVPTSPARFEISLTNTGTAVVSGGHVMADVLATCSRCLCEFPLTIEGGVDGFYIEHGKEDGIPEDQEFEFMNPAGDVDIMPSLLAALVLDAPFAPVHDEECAGLCATCGADLNAGPCGCEGAVDDDNPFAALGALLTDGVPKEES